jgi:NADPH:quinone reductase-like Zn-dependent oxidoreductase
VQLAKHFGARVTAVCSTSNLELVKSLGADEVIDYTKEDFSRAGQVYDVVFDTVGKSGYRRSMRALKRGGFYVRVGGSGKLAAMLADVVRGAWVSVTGAAKMVGGISDGKAADLAFLRELIEKGELKTVIEKRYPLHQIAEAHRHAETGHKKGHVVVSLEQASR